TNLVCYTLMPDKRPHPRMHPNDPGEFPPGKVIRLMHRSSAAIAPSSTNAETSNKPRTPPSTPSVASKDTPYRQGSSHPSSVPTQPSDSSQSRATKETLSLASANEARQYRRSLGRLGYTRSDMEKILCSEVDGAVYQYPKLCHEFFDVDTPQVDHILTNLAANPLLWCKPEGRWSIDCSDLQLENPKMYQALANLLDTIMHAAFKSRPFRPTPQQIIPLAEVRMVGNHSDDTNTSPDVVQGAIINKEKRHWGDLEFFAECKANRNKLGDALMQIARYSWALLTHQIYRKHVFSLALCGTWVTFIRVSRSGLIYSEDINLESDPEAFIRAAAGLFALDDARFGYNTLFYYWPPLDHDVEKSSRELRFVTDNMRWTLVEILCHQMCLVGRATVVILLRRISNPQHHAVLKLIWRPSTRADENDSLLAFQDFPGICRRRWGLSDGSTAVQDPGSLNPSPYQHLFRELGGEEKQGIHESVPLNSSGSQQYQARLSRVKCGKTCKHSDSEVRHYTMVLMDEGVKLWRIQHLVYSITHGHLEGYAHLVMAGQLWLDNGKIDSDSNDIVATLPDHTSARFEFGDISFLVPEDKISSNSPFGDYIEKRYAKQEPLGRLYDFEFVVEEARDDNEVHSVADRTGTFAFMPIAILSATEMQPVRHHFLHDLESFFWVFMWLIFIRADMLDRQDIDSRKTFQKIFYGKSPEDSKLVLLLKVPELNILVNRLVGDDPGWRDTNIFVLKFAALIVKYLHTPKPADLDQYRQLKADEKPGSEPKPKPEPEPELEPGSESNPDPAPAPAPAPARATAPKPKLPLDMSLEERWDIIHDIVGAFDGVIQDNQGQGMGSVSGS
ncbi:hypothetical protein RSAG8_08813, partial [Rhizoctonia solani AG-8 WAC10335]